MVQSHPPSPSVVRVNGLTANQHPFLTPRTMKRAAARTEDALRKLIEVSAVSDNNDVFRAAAEQFYFTCKVKNPTEKTLSTYGEHLENFRRFLDLTHVPFDQVEKQTVQRHILSMKDRVSDHTVNDRIRVLKTFFKFLISEGIWNGGRQNPMDGIQYVRTESKFKPLLCQEELKSSSGSETGIRLPGIATSASATCSGTRSFACAN